jgi:two-component system, OmpR family, copper resistance phosphate regulon response regulator CusR
VRILVAEDDRPVASFLKKGLEAEHYAVDIVPDGQEALYMAEEYDYDLLLLDLVLPKMDGLQVLRQIRNRKKNLPVLVLTGRTRVEDRVKGLDLGADDYMVKPFAFRELTARVRALLRRREGSVDFKLQVDDLGMNLVDRTVGRGERKIELTPKEFALLEYLMRNQGRAVSRPMIIEHVWNFSFDTMTNVVDVYINYLRKKVDGGEASKLIHTVRGVGYRIGNPQ